MAPPWYDAAVPDGSTFSPLEPTHSVGFQSSRSARWDYRVHAHSCFELLYIHSGFGHALVGDHAGTFTPGACFLVGPALPHSFYSDGFLPNAETLVMRLLWFTPAVVARTRAQEFAALQPVLDRSRRGLVLRPPGSDRVAQALRASEQAGPGELLEAAYAVIFAFVQAAHDAPPLATPDTTGPFRTAELERLERVRQILRQRYQQPLSLEAVATQVGLSASAVNLLLRKYTRSSFLETLTAIRVDQARRLLRDTDAEMNAIAQDAGFGSLATFNRRFRAAEQKSPHEYRALHRP